MISAAVVQVFIVLNTVDDREIAVNTSEIVSITKPGGLVTQDAHCMIALTDGKFITVIETCREVIAKLEGPKS